MSEMAVPDQCFHCTTAQAAMFRVALEGVELAGTRAQVLSEEHRQFWSNFYDRQRSGRPMADSQEHPHPMGGEFACALALVIGETYDERAAELQQRKARIHAALANCVGQEAALAERPGSETAKTMAACSSEPELMALRQEFNWGK